MFKKNNSTSIQSISYQIDKNTLFLKTIEGKTEKIIVDFPIRQVIQFKNKLLVRVEPVIGKILNENVYCYSDKGAFLWQINPTDTIDADCPYTHIQTTNDDLFFYNWSGEKIQVDPNNGKILKKEFTK